MKLQVTITFGLALALSSVAGLSFAQVSGEYAQGQFVTPTYQQPVAVGQQPGSPAYAQQTAFIPTQNIQGQTLQAPTVPVPTQQVRVAPTGPTPVANPPAQPPQRVAVNNYPGVPVRVADHHGAAAHAAGSGSKGVAGSGLRPAEASVVHSAPAGHGAPADWSQYSSSSPPSDGYVHYGSSCGSGGCGSGGCGSGAGGCNLSAGNSIHGTRQWFFGLYGLLLDREDRSNVLTAVQINPNPGTGTRVFPGDNADDLFLFSGDADAGFQGGAEIRFGTTFGTSPDLCTGQCYQPFAWEGVFWAISDEPEDVLLIDFDGASSDTIRNFSQRSFAGLQYDRDDDGNFVDVDQFVDFQDPIDNTANGGVRLLAVNVRSNFEAQNVELNLWRFGSPSNGLGTLIGHGATGGCGCGKNCGCDGRYGAKTPAKRLFISGQLGVRYFRTDETLTSSFFFSDTGGTAADNPDFFPGVFDPTDDNVVIDSLEVDNELVGFQVGCSVNRLVGCKGSIFLDSNFGIYGNEATKNQVVAGGGGDLVFEQDGTLAEINATANEVAFLGEMRLGAGYQATKRTRLTAAYRAIALSGVATAGNQNTDFSTPDLANFVNTEGSIILHGIQVGLETRF